MIIINKVLHHVLLLLVESITTFTAGGKNKINGYWSSIVSNFYSYIEFFMVGPGDGDEFMYSPIEVNVTFYCAVNNPDLEWTIDDDGFSGLVEKHRLHSRQIFQSQPVTSSVGVTTSNVTVFGLLENNNSRICCQFLDESRQVQKNCTTLILYGKIIIQNILGS